MNGDGRADNTGWMSGGDGMLVIDRDGDGVITHASEVSFLSEKEGAKNAWEGLGALDNTRDGKIDKSDARFGELKVWIDRNSDGISQSDELKTLTELGITEIALRNVTTSDTVRIGQNLALSTATFKRDNGVTGTIGNVALGFTPTSVSHITAMPPEGRPALVDILTGGPDQVDISPLQAASNLAQAMSIFGADASQGNLSNLDPNRVAAQDWFAAAAA
jgi:hypothetical protein